MQKYSKVSDRNPNEDSDNNSINVSSNQIKIDGIDETTTVEVDLPKEFCEERDKEIFFMIFSNHARTGGGKILEDRSIYDSYTQKALIYYENKDVAKRVGDQGKIIFQKYLFNVRLKYEKNEEKQSIKSSFKSMLSNSSNNLTDQASLTNKKLKQTNKEKSLEAKTSLVRVSNLNKTEKLTVEKVNNRFIFAKDYIIGIDIDPSLNSAIVKFSSIEGKLLIKNSNTFCSSYLSF